MILVKPVRRHRDTWPRIAGGQPGGDFWDKAISASLAELITLTR
jgi:hypothetical protein